MSTHYYHLQPEERITLASLKAQGFSLRSIAPQMNRSTLSRELARNSCVFAFACRSANAPIKKEGSRLVPAPNCTNTALCGT